MTNRNAATEPSLNTQSPGLRPGFVRSSFAAALLASTLALPCTVFAQVPVITGVSGCTDQSPETFDCPTLGGTRLTITGANFGANGASARVGFGDCDSPSGDDFSLVCDLPPGSGSGVGVQVVDAAGVASVPVPSVSYGAPVITSLEGCPQGGCPRVGGVILTIHGANFGPSSARVLIDGEECPGASSNHSRITCELPAGSGLGIPVRVLSATGDFSTNTSTYDYEQCSPGTFLDGFSCVECPLGFFSAGFDEEACTPCSPGFISTVSRQECQQCPAGTFAGSQGSSVCESCPVGSTSPSGAATCSGSDALQCWKAKDLKSPRFTRLSDVSVVDELSSGAVDLKKPALVCLPAAVAGAALLGDGTDYQCCYKASGDKLNPAVQVATDDAIAGTLSIELKKRDLVCEPCSVSVEP